MDLTDIVQRVREIEADLAAQQNPVHIEPPPSWDAPILAPESAGQPGWFAYVGVVLVGAFIIGVAVISAIAST